MAMSEFVESSVIMEEDPPNSSWYPSKPPTNLKELSESSLLKLSEIEKVLPNCAVLPEPHPIWENGTLKYTNTNKWSSIPNHYREKCMRSRIHGVEVRTLPVGHFLAGECGLFAIQKFGQFDVIGEYTGKIVTPDKCGHYVACLEDKGSDDSLGIDAENCGNELRFINSYLNVAFKPNCTMRTVYVNSYPHIIIICTENIEIGDELLLDYGEGYTNAFLKPKKKVGGVVPNEKVRHALPGYGSDSTSDGENDSSDDE